MDGTKLLLKHDIISSSKGNIYGYQGEQVILVTTFDHVWIVQNESGQRFSVTMDQVTGLPVEKKEAAPAAVATDNKTITHRAPAAKKKTAAPINQNTLF